MKTSHLFSTLLLALLAIGSVQESPAQVSDVDTGSRDSVRAIRNPDGTRSIYVRRGKSFTCSTYTASGKLAAILDYKKGENGVMLGCVVYDSTRSPIFKVVYGYDSKARLVEERMFTYTDKKLVQRVIYRYDASGNRSKPLIISLDAAGSKVTPTMERDVNDLNRNWNKGRNNGN